MAADNDFEEECENDIDLVLDIDSPEGDNPKITENRTSVRRHQYDRRGSAVQNRTVDQGKYVFREREVGDLAFVILKGEIDILRSTEEGEILLNTISQGTLFGEMALIDNQPRMASALVTNGPAELMVISKDIFQKKLDVMDTFTLALVTVLTSHIRSLADQINLLKKAS